jgi:hypothetical protein
MACNAHAAFVARAPRLDALANPDFFLRELLVEQRVRLRFRVQAFLAAAQVVVVVARPTRDAATVDFDDARRERAQEAAIVGDEHDAAGKIEQQFLEPVDRLDVEMVGRLVEQQHIRIEHERTRKQHAALHTTGLRGERGIFRQVEPRQHVRDAALDVPSVFGVDARCTRASASALPGTSSAWLR